MEKIEKKTEKDLKKELGEAREKLSKIALGRASGTKPHERQALRKDIARILTELNKRRTV